MTDPFAVVKPIPAAYDLLRLGEVTPAGWIRRQMQCDLEHGFLGHLDALVPALVCHDDIYGRDRLTQASRHKDLGTVATDAALQVQHMWWNSETQSNWWDGLVRTALLLDHPAALARVREYVDRMLATQDPDGYLGIYAPDLRFSFTGENGELWAQATLFRALLGYYEATGEARVLAAVERAARVTMTAYPAGASQPFPAETSVCGDSHGLAITDTFERLAELTGNQAYAAYAAWLYAAYSMSHVSQYDAQYARLVDPGRRFVGHGVHTYEHLRSLLVAAHVTGNPALAAALDGYVAKLDRCLTPSGGPIGDEFIEARDASASETGYEYCSIHELLDAYTHLLRKRGAATWGDRAEWLLFNAGQGARYPAAARIPAASGITYLRTDNCTSLTGPLHPGDPDLSNGPQTRYKFSPVHQDVAVCCVPNAGRIYPYYVRSMWMRSDRGLVAALHGPCEVRTQVAGVDVCIAEETRYPFELDITFAVEAAIPVEFELAFRLPEWAKGFECLLASEAHAGVPVAGPAKDGFLRLNRTWQSGDRVTLRFAADVAVHDFRPGERFLSYGPLVFARPIRARVTLGRDYGGEGSLAGVFVDRYYSPADGDAVPHCLPTEPASAFRVDAGASDPDDPWQSSLALEGDLLAPDAPTPAPARLVPMGGTILRQVTFPTA